MPEEFGQLVPCGGGDPIPLLKPSLLVGRRSRCDITLRFSNVSSHHCEMTFENGYWKITDLNSSNGIKVNGERCESKWLMPGDKVSVAKHEYEIHYTANSELPPPVDDDVDIFSVSLMERAGLARRQSRPPASQPPRPEKSGKGDSDEDLAASFLNDPE